MQPTAGSGQGKPKETTVIPNTLSIEQQIFNKRVKDFDTELSALQEKYKVVVVPNLAITKYGIIPQIEYRDKEELDRMQRENQMKDAAKNPLIMKAGD